MSRFFKRPDKRVQVVALAWLTSRLWLALFAYIGHFSRGDAPLGEGSWVGVSNLWLNVWTTYDSKHFIDIAARGYTPEDSVFFPLYPLLMRAFGPDQNALALAGIVISHAAFAGALWLLYDLTRRQYTEQTAILAVWVLALFPCAVYSGAVYTESLWLLLGLASFSSARREQWLWAGVWGMGAALTRNAGPVLALALAVMWWQSERRDRLGLVGSALPLVAFIAMQFYFRGLFGDALSSVANQAQFGRALIFPLVPLWLNLVDFVTLKRLDIVTILNWSGTVAAFGLAWKHRRVQPRGDAILLCSVVFLNLLFARGYPLYTSSALRYLFGLWPFCQLLALEMGALNPRFRALASVLALMLAACLSILFGAKEFLG